MIFTFFNFWNFWNFYVDLLSGFYPSYTVCSVTGFFQRLLWDVLFPKMDPNLFLTAWTSRYIKNFTLILRLCGIGSPGAFPLYYSRVENVKFYSTSHFKFLIRRSVHRLSAHKMWNFKSCFLDLVLTNFPFFSENYLSWRVL